MELKTDGVETWEPQSIEGRQLAVDDIGEVVTYLPDAAAGDRTHPDADKGHIMQWHRGGVFVKFTRGTALINPANLVWG
jgi:hypothetical protein